MLLVTTTMRMVDGVHSDTTDTGVVILLGMTLPPGSTSSEERLVRTLATGDNTDHSAAATHNSLTDTRGKTDTGLGEVFVVSNDNSGGTGGTGVAATVTKLCLNIADNSAFGHGGEGQDVADDELGFAAAIDELARVHALNSDKVLSLVSVAILILECDLCEGSTTARIVQNVLHNALDVTLAFSKVVCAEAGGGNALACAAFENG